MGTKKSSASLGITSQSRQPKIVDFELPEPDLPEPLPWKLIWTCTILTSIPLIATLLWIIYAAD